MRNIRNIFLSVIAFAVLFATSAAAQTTKPFSGAKVNAGTVTASKDNGKIVLSLSSDFQQPGTPDPHWQVVDSKGKTYLLDRLQLKGDKNQTKITVPSYVPDVAKVQIYCAWAEAVLGETSFDKPVK